MSMARQQAAKNREEKPLKKRNCFTRKADWFEILHSLDIQTKKFNWFYLNFGKTTKKYFFFSKLTSIWIPVMLNLSFVLATITFLSSYVLETFLSEVFSSFIHRALNFPQPRFFLRIHSTHINLVMPVNPQVYPCRFIEKKKAQTNTNSRTKSIYNFSWLSAKKLIAPGVTFYWEGWELRKVQGITSNCVTAI